jgi:hypothetical protein
MRALLCLALSLAAASAHAYPQFQFSTDAVRCNQCHYAPAGGGLISGYGRDEAGDTISSGGNGGFLHGAWSPPSWLALGGDFRVAGLVNNVGATEGAEITWFPMQADLYARGEVGPVSLYATVGLRGAVRADEPQLTSRFISREHFLMWRPRNVGPYVRGGRFFVPYGLRLAEHPVYVRRFLGFNTLEETYNVSGGYVHDRWEVHASAFTPDFIRPVGHRGSGGALSYERRLGRRAALGGQARVAVGPDDTRAQGGLVGKLYLDGASLLLLGQVDLVRQVFDEVDAPRWQLAGIGSATWLFRRGFMLTGMLERWDQDLAVRGVARSAAGLHLQWFPTAHVEVALYGRAQLIGTGKGDGDPSQLVLLQLHYYL